MEPTVAGIIAGTVWGLLEFRRRSTVRAEVPILDCTGRDFEYPRDIRHRGDPEFKEVTGDVFDRQRCIPEWDQGVIESLDTYVLGTGGLGQDVAMGLARLGVNSITLLDRDTYDPSNVTRQCLGGLKDVGRRKVDCAADNLDVHNIRSKIATQHMDAVISWNDVVATAKASSVVFNCIDFGAMFDYSINSLCKELRIPLVAGSSYGYDLQTEFYPGAPDSKCFSCNNGTSSCFGIPMGKKDREAFPASVTAWMEANSVRKLDKAGILQYATGELNMCGPVVAELVDEALASLGDEEVVTADSFLTVLEKLQVATLARLAPGRIGKLDSIEFIPREAHPATRNVGSWCCICVMSAMLMVNAMVQYVTGPDGKKSVPNWAFMNLCSVSAQTDRQMGGTDASDGECQVCKAAQELHAAAGTN